MNLPRAMRSFGAFFAVLSLTMLAFGSSCALQAQDPMSAQVQQVAGLTLPEAPAAAVAALPEDPGAALFADGLLHKRESPVASKYAKRIRERQAAQTIDEKDKIVLGLEDLYSPFSLLGILGSAGYSHLLNGQPNYGTNSGAFAERFGATAVRDTTEGLFTDAVFSPLLHEDPRYYVEGSRYGLVHRTLYAVTRPLVTRTDSGHRSVNGALLLGYAASSALTATYYPRSNRNFHDVASTYGDSIGGAAFGFAVSEFTDDVLQRLHLEKKP